MIQKATKEAKIVVKPKDDSPPNKHLNDRQNRSENESQTHEYKSKSMASSMNSDIRDRNNSQTSPQSSSSTTGVSRKIVRNSNEKESSVISKSSPSMPNSHSAQSAIIPVLNEVLLLYT